MSKRELVSIAGCVVFTAAVLFCAPYRAVASVPGHGAAHADDSGRSEKSPGAAEVATMAQGDQGNQNDQGNCGISTDWRVVPSCASPFGATYSEWSQSWWQWFFHLTAWPDGVSADCSTHQLGPVWFLVGGAPNNPINCTVPVGKALFFPILNVECSNLEAPPFYGATAADRRACAKGIMDTATSLQVTIDGVAVQNLTSFRAATPDHDFTVPDGNIANIPTDKSHSGKSAADGYYVMLTPLAPGTHTLHFTGTIPPFGYTLVTDYILTVKAGW